MNIRSRLSIFWVVVMLNMLFADIFSIMVELVDKNTINIPGDVKITMAIAAIMTNIPILMIYLSNVLPFKINRMVNIGAAIFTIIYIIGGGSLMPHYFICGGIEIVFLMLILSYSWKWSNDKSVF